MACGTAPVLPALSSAALMRPTRRVNDRGLTDACHDHTDSCDCWARSFAIFAAHFWALSGSPCASERTAAATTPSMQTRRLASDLRAPP